ncbi:HAD family hydrolase [Undibacterium seohonense]|uniref:phosphoglycolate phosphatase n=1 Tax=Undibacterium seohonense TaxID=1344950 RepID=A0ABR6WZT0_9BURK|nr:HAD hydrolase-like protein [Undibacterium seohonense]MBC3806152.1 HAD family hydrolase [Undibacterium seohonense]
MYPNRQKMIIFDADGTIIDAFSAIERTFARHDMAIGDLESFQKRHKFFKYLGGLKEFPINIKKQLGKKSRQQVLTTLTDIYREEAQFYAGFADLIKQLIAQDDIRVGLVTRNVSHEPRITMEKLFARHDIDLDDLDYFAHVPIRASKADFFKAARKQFEINPARAYACGDEHKDYASALAAGMVPFVVSYGFEDHKRLTKKFDIPDDIISNTPQELCARIRNSLDLPG